MAHASFQWDDPFLLDQQLTEDERKWLNGNVERIVEKGGGDLQPSETLLTELRKLVVKYVQP